MKVCTTVLVDTLITLKMTKGHAHNTHSLPVPPLSPLSSPCQRAQEMMDGFPKGSNARLESYLGWLYTTFISVKVRHYQQQVEMIPPFPIDINNLQGHTLRPGMGF